MLLYIDTMIKYNFVLKVPNGIPLNYNLISILNTTIVRNNLTARSYFQNEASQKLNRNRI